MAARRRSPSPRPLARRTARGPAARAARLAGLTLAWLLMVVTALWAVLALGCLDHLRPALQFGLAAVFAGIALAALVGFLTTRWRRRACLAYGAALVLVGAAWASQRPSNDRPWQPETAVLAYATVAGDQVTVHNIRNFAYRSETDFTPAYYDRTFDLSRLESVDLVASYWMGPHIAHIFLTFGFAGNQHLAFSIEARKEMGEGYSSLKGFFRQYELYYVVADERDVIRVRSNYRQDPPEEVHLYPLNGAKAAARRLFLEYVRQINDLKDHPQFYNTLTTNCTSTIWLNSRVNPGHLPFSWKLLLSGHVPEFLFENGRLRGDLPFRELERRSLINERARPADQAPDFSMKIRQVPGA